MCCALQWSGTNSLPHFSPDISELFTFIHLVTFSHQVASKSCPHVTVRNVKCPCKCHEGIWGSGCVAALILHSGTRWRSVASLMLRPLHPWGWRPQYQLCRRLDGPQSRSRLFIAEKNLLLLPRAEP